MDETQSLAEGDTVGGNLLIPAGLLRGVSNRPYDYTRRHNSTTEAASGALTQLVQQPTEAILATHPVQRSRTIDLGPGGRAQIGFGSQYTDGRLSIVRPSISERLRAGSSAIERLNSLRQDIRTPSPVLVRPSQRDRTLTRSRSNRSPSPVLVRPARPESVLSVSSQSTVSGYSIRANGRETRLGLHPSAEEEAGKVREIDFQPVTSNASRPSGVRFSHIPSPETVDRTATNDTTGKQSFLRKASVAIAEKFKPSTRRSSVRQTYEKAQQRQKQLQRSKPFQIFFTYTCYLLLLAFVYFVLVGRPLWGGTIWYIYVLFQYHLTFVGGTGIFVGLATFYAFGPLLTLFESPAPDVLTANGADDVPRFPPAPFVRPSMEPIRDAVFTEKPLLNQDTALLIPCYKSAGLLPATLEHALKVFPASSIFILANGNSPTPLDNTEEVCNTFGVNHVWIPVGSKIVAQYVGAYVARSFPYQLLIDDDCLLPPNFPIVSERLTGRIKCLGYTLASIGEGRSRGTWCQQAQDLEYKLSGLQRLFAGKIGSATFPHGAIVLWDTEFLIRTFKEHPGFSVSEDWFFGHVARMLGSRITMCSSVFVETETPSSVFFAGGGSRGGFGEMTVFKQRFKRWNFFFVNGCYYNLAYILFSWKLGWWEIGAKLFVFQEVYETFLYLITPIVLPISFFVRPTYTSYLFAATLGLYFLNAMIFNEVHLRLAGRMVKRNMLIFYYMPFKFVLTFVNVASCWWSLWQYAKYFAKRHPRIIEDEKAVGVVLRIEEDAENRQGEKEVLASGAVGRPLSQISTRSYQSSRSSHRSGHSGRPRRLTVTAIPVDIVRDPFDVDPLERVMTADGAPDVWIEGVETPDVTTHSKQLDVNSTGWVGNWSLGRTGTRRRPRPQSDVLQPVVEHEDEDDEEDEALAGYSYYGV